MSLVDINQPTNELPEIPAETVSHETTPDIVDINIEGVKKQKFRINGDNDKVVELNISDLGIYDRLKSGYNVLMESMEKIQKMDTESDDLSDQLKEADKVMREQIDYIFDYPVSDVCAKYGTMYDPINGMFRWEHIIDALTNLYANNINQEYKKMRTRVQKHTDKYVGDHQQSTKKGNTKSKRK